MRQKLPNRRPNEIVDFEYDGQRYTAAISRFPSGDVAEIFLTAGKYGAAVHLHAQDSAILASLALQSDVPVETIVHAIKGPIGQALSLFEVRR
ncbi:hypothetical protein GPL21_39180 [Bradyrhizobium pachyrhizi]|uniref:ribonucleoside-diphosphate reductase n=1 Tax=Bradyrhizobium pachyrhizi TaxID=280333 RepID=A0A844SVS0_9BRAD|nr:hypothetical protein [Bradyrhizobium pachyrhizi]MVT71068.1 hypothetical protein [Bradyrhizobium pachyrhizi]